jgi:predicted O-methyltransferase YrrM
MEYTEDWFTDNIVKFNNLIPHYSSFECKLLEIGSFEGRSSNWFVENLCQNKGSSLTCIDTFMGSWEHSSTQTNNLYERFLENTRLNSNKIRVIREGSEFALPRLLSLGEKFDFIYVDGNHTFDAVMCDAIYSHQLLTPGGIIIFDDYGWGLDRAPNLIPHHAINAFLAIHRDEYDIIGFDYQVSLRKKEQE